MKKNTTIITAVMLALALFFAFCTGRIYAKTVGAFADEDKVVYLTFDDGPSNSVTPRVLDVLAEYGVPATFFVVGKEVETRTRVFCRIAEEGHAIGIHSYDHVYRRIYASKEALLADIARCGETVSELLGVAPKLYRFPGGSFHIRDELLSAVRSAGYTAVDWNATCGDEEIYRASPERLLGETKRTARGKNRVILLCHDSPTHKNTADALPAIIEFFRAQHYRFAALEARSVDQSDPTDERKALRLAADGVCDAENRKDQQNRIDADPNGD